MRQENFLIRKRKFTPLNFFTTVLRLASGTNNDGYHSALMNAWGDCELKSAPSKSSLSEMRDKISHTFFEEIFRNDLKTHDQNRRLYRGYHVYAVDGDQLDLPASEDVLKIGYRGYPFSRNRETHYPKMYMVQTLDILNGEVREFSYSTHQDETHLARVLAQGYERNSITLYDRLHCGHGTFYAHHAAGNYFIARGRTTGAGVSHEMKKFCESSSRAQEVSWYAQPGERSWKPDLRVRLIKVKHPRENKDIVYVTNLPAGEFTRKEIADFYRRRWDIETSFKDLTSTLKMEARHSKKLNGILQEIYTLLWLVNSVRRQLFAVNEVRAKDVFKKRYRKGNFKLGVSVALRYFGLLVKGVKEFSKHMEYWIRRSTETRYRYSRSYPRVVKCRGADYEWNNFVKRRPR